MSGVGIFLWRLWFLVLIYICGAFLILTPSDDSIDDGDVGYVGNGANIGNVDGVDDVTGSKVEQNAYYIIITIIIGYVSIDRR